MKKQFIYSIVKLAAILSLSVFALSCGSDDKDVYVSLNVNSKSLEAAKGSIFVTVNSNGTWTIALQDENGQNIDWANLTPNTGKGNGSVVLSYKANNSNDKRTLVLNAECEGVKGSLVLEQKGLGSSDDNKPNVDDGNSDSQGGADDSNLTGQNVPRWMEIPATNDSKYKFYYHLMTLDGKKTRNYSYYYDRENLLSVWVAYPLCRWNIGSAVRRTNAWGLDPNMSANDQPVLYKGYKERPFDRGHQIPSGDRLCSREANVATFYFTNMTPQLHDFNSGLWENLENRVRTWARSSDTLYVVTGCVAKGSSKINYDNNNKKAPVPVAYYKALLRYKKNSTLGHKGYMGVGFYFDHSPHSGEKLKKSMAISLKELEDKIGTTFFVNLPSAIGKDEATIVKNENPQSVNWWWSN